MGRHAYPDFAKRRQLALPSLQLPDCHKGLRSTGLKQTSVHMSIQKFTHVFTHMPIHMPIHMPTRMPTRMSIHNYAHMSSHMFTHMSTRMHTVVGSWQVSRHCCSSSASALPTSSNSVLGPVTRTRWPRPMNRPRSPLQVPSTE